MLASEVINCLQSMIDQNGDLQVAVYDDGSCSHIVDLHFRVARREDEVVEPEEIDEELEDVFISIY